MDTENRYHRQSLIPNWNQEELTKAKVLVLGVGATGSFLSVNLALSGIGHLILVDFDTIEKSNLNRQLLFHEGDIGKNKAEIAAQRLALINPGIKIDAFPKAMEQLPKSFTDGLDVIACCLDTFLGRRWANSLSLRENVPMVNGGMYAFMGDIQTIIPNETACFECQPLIGQDKLSQACTPLGEQRKGMEEDKKEMKIPSVATLSSIISGLMSQEILKLIMKVGTPVRNFMFYDGLSNSFTELPLNKNPNCPICGENYKLKSASVLAFHGETVAEFLHRIALAFGMADPEIMYKGRFLDKTNIFSVHEGDVVYIRDERLAAPISLKIELHSD
ncbi:MAG: ThiF family adenylyltransferase [Candidatus Heimdallarchaeota archaeon]|nr:ThiF family adenylyltransferase [Candidatus Heimdallarchaeota archaeon]